MHAQAVPDGVIVGGVQSPIELAETRRPVRVVLADDHARHRQLVALVLGLDERIEVVGQASDGAEAITLVRELDPDVVLLDARMPGIGGIEACARIGEESPATHCVMLTMADDADEIEAAFTAGAKAYIFKATAMADITDTVLRVARLGSAAGRHPFADGRLLA